MKSSSSSGSSSGFIVSNRNLINNDTSEEIDNYIDDICSDPTFLCKNRELCGTSTSIYTSVQNVNDICEKIEKSNECEYDVKECVVLANNSFDQSKQYISTSFINIIIPIKDALDEKGNQKFLRLPALSGTKNKNSNDICNICECMNRFATSPGASGNTSTSPGQNTCVYLEQFEYYYYPIYIENINSKLKDAPPTKIKNYTVLNKNIIYANTEEDLLITNLYELLTENEISEHLTLNFIKMLYGTDVYKIKQLEYYIASKKKENKIQEKKTKFYTNITFYYIIFVIFLLFLFSV
jgi:hypothetical protein